MKKAFTLFELMVAVGILALILSFAGVVFNASIGTYRVAAANSEIMRKFRAIADQLDSDFDGLRKDDEIFVIWVAKPRPLSDPCDPSSYERFDRIMFFADGDFQSYGTFPIIRGNVARISYMLGSKYIPLGSPVRAQSQKRADRVLTRTQHILTSDPAHALFFDPNGFSDIDWYNWHNRTEYDKMAASAAEEAVSASDESLSLQEWKHLPAYQKQEMLTVITDVNVTFPLVGPLVVGPDVRGAQVDPSDPNTIHMLLCQGVGEFEVQGWYDARRQWVPEVDPDANGVLEDSHFFLDNTGRIPGVLYPFREFADPCDNYGGEVIINNLPWFPQTSVTEANFNRIPGLGRALKFTFTLFDSKGIIEQGRTFTHIVYLDKDY